MMIFEIPSPQPTVTRREIAPINKRATMKLNKGFTPLNILAIARIASIK